MPPPPLPKSPLTELKSTAQLYWLYAFFLTVPLTLVAVLAESTPDRLGVILLSCAIFYLLLLVAAGLLLFQKRKAGLYLGWALLPLILLSIPVGTAVGIFIITKITRPEVKALLV